MGQGCVGRRAFLGWGIALALIKYNGDRILAYPTSWNLVEPTTLYAYLFTWWPWGGSPEGLQQGGKLLLWSLPFVWVGSMLTLARLRDARINPWWVVLFFVPAVKLLFFVILSAVPTGLPGDAALPQTPRWPRAQRWLPRTRLGCAFASATYSGLLGVGLIAFGTEILRTYGWALFVATPFFLGLVSALLFAVHHPLRRSDATGLAVLSIAIAGLLLFGLAMEGVICLAMAAPIAAILAILGAWIARAILIGSRNVPEDRLLCLAVLAMPALMAGEANWAPEPRQFTVMSETVIDASPEKIWPLVVNVSPLPPAVDRYARAGIATFQRAWTDGEGINAVRYCEFNLGLAREPVEIWQPPHRLKLRVETTPPPMEEWTVYPHIHPEHLDGFYQVTGAEFRLEPAPEGTRVRGITVYQHGLWPADYWSWWCNSVVRTLQQRVLAEVKARAERPKP